MSPKKKPIRRSARRRLTSDPKHVCANCGCVFEGTYCNDCGQHHDTRRLTTRELWDNIAFSFVNFDRGIPNTVRRLFAHPGKMIREYIFGHRVSYSHPIALLILLCTLYGIVIGITHASLAVPGGGVTAEVSKAVSGLGDSVSDVMDNVKGDGAFGRALHYLFDLIRNSTIFQAVLPVPFFAWAVRRLFRKYGSRDYNYAEILFACLYMASQRMLISIVIEPFIIAFPDADMLSTIKVALYVFLAAWTFREMFGTAWGKSLWKSALMFIFGWTLFGLVVAGLVVVLVLVAILVAFIASLFQTGGVENALDQGNKIIDFINDMDI